MLKIVQIHSPIGISIPSQPAVRLLVESHAEWWYLKKCLAQPLKFQGPQESQDKALNVQARHSSIVLPRASRRRLQQGRNVPDQGTRVGHIRSTPLDGWMDGLHGINVACLGRHLGRHLTWRSPVQSLLGDLQAGLGRNYTPVVNRRRPETSCRVMTWRHARRKTKRPT